MDDRYDLDDSDHHARRDTDQNAATRLTGLSAQQLIVQLIGGLLLAGVVGLLSGWATQQVMSQQLANMSHQLNDMRLELRQMRRDLYAPRVRPGRLEALAAPDHLPPGRP